MILQQNQKQTKKSIKEENKRVTFSKKYVKQKEDRKKSSKFVL